MRLATLTVLSLGLGAAPQSKAKAPALKLERATAVVELQVAGRPQVGAPAQAEFTLRSQPNYHLNDDFPIHFTATGGKTITFTQPRFDRPSAEPLGSCASDPEHHCSATLTVAFAAQKAGAATLEGTLAFAACDADHCVIEKVPVSAPIDVQ